LTSSSQSLLVLSALTLLLIACGSRAANRREIELFQTDDSCAPQSVDLTAGEKVTFVVHNNGKKDKELEGIDGTKLEEVLVPAGRTRRVNFTAPGTAGTPKLKCYVPGGASTIIELHVTGPATGGQDPSPAADGGPSTRPVSDSIEVRLVEYSVDTSGQPVKAGAIRFAASNISTSQVHELAVMRQKAEGAFEILGEIEDLEPGSRGELILDLEPGRYTLACLIVPGEAGSTIDHFKAGMSTALVVE
jgi:uncharacterized cupredoxin-like copper-binding protein